MHNAYSIIRELTSMGEGIITVTVTVEGCVTVTVFGNCYRYRDKIF